MPALTQEQLVPPEIRIYVIGKHQIAFQIAANTLDYRDAENVTVSCLEQAPAEPLSGLLKLMSRLGMNYGAADFKTHPETGELVFLEINSGPMFARFNYESNGAVCDAILDTLATCD